MHDKDSIGIVFFTNRFIVAVRASFLKLRAMQVVYNTCFGQESLQPQAPTTTTLSLNIVPHGPMKIALTKRMEIEPRFQQSS